LSVVDREKFLELAGWISLCIDGNQVSNKPDDCQQAVKCAGVCQ